MISGSRLAFFRLGQAFILLITFCAGASYTLASSSPRLSASLIATACAIGIGQVCALLFAPTVLHRAGLNSGFRVGVALVVWCGLTVALGVAHLPGRQALVLVLGGLAPLVVRSFRESHGESSLTLPPGIRPRAVLGFFFSRRTMVHVFDPV